MLITALGCLPCVEGEFYLHVKGTVVGADEADYPDGATVYLPGFTTAVAAEHFSHEVFTAANGIGSQPSVVFCIRAGMAHSLGAFCKNTSVIFPPGMQFKITGRRELYAGRGSMLAIDLGEL
jgi:hypothetical protein